MKLTRKPRLVAREGAAAAIAEANREKPARVTVIVPRDRFKAFKLATVQSDENMSDVLLRAIDAYIRKNE